MHGWIALLCGCWNHNQVNTKASHTQVQLGSDAAAHVVAVTSLTYW